MLSAGVVRRLATAAGNAAEYVSQEHGAPIDFNRLSHCNRRVIPIYGNLSDAGDSVPNYMRTLFGPSYHVEFCTPSGVRAVRIRAFARTLTTLGLGGELVFPGPVHTTDLIPFGIPLHPLADLSPEFAVRLV